MVDCVYLAVISDDLCSVFPIMDTAPEMALHVSTLRAFQPNMPIGRSSQKFTPSSKTAIIENSIPRNNVESDHVVQIDIRAFLTPFGWRLILLLQ